MVQKMAKKVLRKRSESIEQLAAQEFDVAIVGGGINGAVAAAALAGHGVKVALIEKEDFACGVSSQSSNLAWGGIKYMETFELGLVRKLCQSRNRLTELFPSAVREVRFLTVVRNNFRWPAFLLYLGSVLYWFLGSFKTRPPRYLSKKQIRRLEPVLEVSDASAGFEYSDCHFEDNDARFVFNMVRAARDSGAITANYVSAVQSERIGNRWQIDAQDEVSGRKFLVRAKVFINACGPYVDELNQRSNQKTEHRHLFSKGVHLIVKRVTEQRRVLTLFASDGRPFFVIPMGDRTCVGTTDTEVDDPLVSPTRIVDSYWITSTQGLYWIRRWKFQISSPNVAAFAHWRFEANRRQNQKLTHNQTKNPVTGCNCHASMRLISTPSAPTSAFLVGS